MLQGESHCVGSGIFQMLHIIFYCLTFIIVIQLENAVLNLSGRYSTVIKHCILIYYDYLYKTVIRWWVKMYVISCINMTL